MKRAIAVLALMSLASLAYASTLSEMSGNLSTRGALRAMAFDGNCSYFAGERKKLSPSTTDIIVWRTCWIPETYFGNHFGSSIYRVRVDCSAKQYARLESVSFTQQFWQGTTTDFPPSGLDSWSDISVTFKEIQQTCWTDEPRAHLSQFDAPRDPRITF